MGWDGFEYNLFENEHLTNKAETFVKTTIFILSKIEWLGSFDSNQNIIYIQIGI